MVAFRFSWTCAVVAVLAALAPSTHGVPLSEKQALIDLYVATGGAHWEQNDNWLVTADPCTWIGVGCAGISANVNKLHLPHNNLVGTLPASMGNLTLLAYVISLPPVLQ